MKLGCQFNQFFQHSLNLQHPVRVTSAPQTIGEDLEVGVVAEEAEGEESDAEEFVSQKTFFVLLFKFVANKPKQVPVIRLQVVVRPQFANQARLFNL